MQNATDNAIQQAATETVTQMSPAPTFTYEGWGGTHLMPARPTTHTQATTPARQDRP